LFPRTGWFQEEEVLSDGRIFCVKDDIGFTSATYFFSFYSYYNAVYFFYLSVFSHINVMSISKINHVIAVTNISPWKSFSERSSLERLEQASTSQNLFFTYMR
jgi:hypothetical protein